MHFVPYPPTLDTPHQPMSPRFFFYNVFLITALPSPLATSTNPAF